MDNVKCYMEDIVKAIKADDKEAAADATSAAMNFYSQRLSSAVSGNAYKDRPIMAAALSITAKVVAESLNEDERDIRDLLVKIFSDYIAIHD